LTVWYATNQTESSSEQNQNSVIQSNPAPIAEQTPIVSDFQEPEVSNKPSSENVAQSKVKPTVKDKTIVETDKTPVEIAEPVDSLSEAEKNEKPVKAKNQTPTPRSAPAQAPRPPRAKQPAAVEQQQPAVSSIETIMTGVPSEKQQPRDNQRQRRQMSDEEKDEQSRRRAEDVLRQNRQPVPPN
jgi:hypothetical protein